MKAGKYIMKVRLIPSINLTMLTCPYRCWEGRTLGLMSTVLTLFIGLRRFFAAWRTFQMEPL